MSLLSNFTPNSARRWDAEGSVGHMVQLVGRLRALGVEPTEAKAYDAIRAVTAAPPPFPSRILDRAPAELVALADEIGAREAGAMIAATRLMQMQMQAQRELQESMAAEVDSYLDQLRPAFDEAALVARRCVELGIQPTDDHERIMRRGPQAVAAWLEFKDGSALATLDRIGSARIEMSLALGVPPVHLHLGSHNPIDYGACFTKPAAPFGPDDQRTKVVGWRRWLSLAPHLHLTALDEL